MFGFFKDLFTSQFKLRNGYKEAIKDIKSGKVKEGPNVAPGVTKDDYLKRYSNLMISFLLFSLIEVYLITGIFSAKSLTAFLFSITAIVFCASVLVKYSYTSWKFHIIYESWTEEGDYSKVNEFCFADYLAVISRNPVRFIPWYPNKHNDPKK
jgi:NADH:ubiquinone oxidoreductase subunit 3 (subunit A)